MPIYEYRCDACGKQLELILKIGEEARPTCPSCRKRMRRVISQTAFVLKGSGWYVTDYPSDARKKGLEADKPPAVAEGSGGEKKKETQTAEKKTPAQAPPGNSSKKKGRKNQK
jgi:putative FmdB family regulatory protein